jgi:hypothetical protein
MREMSAESSSGAPEGNDLALGGVESFGSAGSFAHCKLAQCDVPVRLVSRPWRSFRAIRHSDRQPRFHMCHDGPPLALCVNLRVADMFRLFSVSMDRPARLFVSLCHPPPPSSRASGVALRPRGATSFLRRRKPTDEFAAYGTSNLRNPERASSGGWGATRLKRERGSSNG